MPSLFRILSRGLTTLLLAGGFCLMPGDAPHPELPPGTVLLEAELVDNDLTPLLSGSTPEAGELTLVLDTGGSWGMLLDKSLTPLLGSPRSELRLNGGESTGHLHHISAFAAGRFMLKNISAAVVDFDIPGRYLGANIKGILGWPAFRGRIVGFDFDRRLTTIAMPPFTPVPGMQKIPLDLDRKANLPVIEMEILGKRERFMVDTGYTGGIHVNQSLFDQWTACGLIDIKARQHQTAGLNRVTKIRSSTFRQATLLGMDCSGLIINTDDREQKLHLLGIGFLRRLNFVLDFQKWQFHYQVRYRVPPASYLPNLLGGQIIYRPQFAEVESLGGKESLLVRAGLKAGDRILQIGPLVGEEMSLHSLSALLQNRTEASLPLVYLHEGVRQETRLVFDRPPPEKAASSN